MTRVFSGIQPTGTKHLGNYIGAIRQYVADQDKGEAFYCVVDLHSISVPYDPDTLHENTLDTAATLHASLRRGGLFTPVFGSRAEPDYLVLIDRASFADAFKALSAEAKRYQARGEVGR